MSFSGWQAIPKLLLDRQAGIENTRSAKPDIFAERNCPERAVQEFTIERRVLK
jgi:hypothetical protein